MYKKHNISMENITLTASIPDAEFYGFSISCIHQVVKIFEQNRRGEIMTIGEDGKAYLPKDQPGFKPGN